MSYLVQGLFLKRNLKPNFLKTLNLIIFFGKRTTLFSLKQDMLPE